MIRELHAIADDDKAEISDQIGKRKSAIKAMRDEITQLEARLERIRVLEAGQRSLW